MKMKNDHRSKFSNLSNWKKEAWKKNQGFNGTRDLCVAGALLYQLSYELSELFRSFIFIHLQRSSRVRSARSGTPWVKNVVNYPSEKIW